ncbi:MAG: O-antigen ligase family protein [Bacilli bacterium]|nr:O-antigen ligase family protein [Bacilli bacterium]
MAIRQRNLLTNILFWITMIFLAYFAENVVVFDLSNFQRGFTLLEYILLFAGVISILGYYFYNEYKYNGIQPKWLIATILLLIVISAAIGIFLTPDVQYFETIVIIDEAETLVVREYSITLIGKIRSLLYVIIAAIGVYIQLVILPRLISFKMYILFLMYIIVAVALISAIISYFLDFDSYVHLYYHGLYGYDYPQSFVFNRNMYALMLLLGMLALYVTISYLPKWYNYVFLIFLFVNIFFTFSKAALGVALITFVFHFIYRMIVTFKKSKIRNVIYLVLVGILGICGILLIPFPFFMDIQLFNEARRFILEYYVELGVGSYESRVGIWNSVLELSTGIHLWFGRGLHLFNQTLGFYHSGVESSGGVTNYFSHNGFLEILGQWGLVGLIPYCLGILAIFAIDIYIAIKDYKVGIPALIIFGAFLGYTMVETSTLFDLTIEGITTTTLVALPSLSWLYAKRHPQENKAIVETAENIEYKMPTFDKKRFERQTAKYVALFLGVATLFAFYYFRQTSSEISSYLMFIALLVTVFISLPRTLGNEYELRKNKKGIVFGLLFFLTLLVYLASLFVLAYTSSPLVFLLSLKLIIVALIISEVFFKKEKTPIMSYFSKIITQAAVLLIAIIITGSLVIFLYSDLTWFILSEINTLFIIFSIPLIREFDIANSKLNNKMVLLFAREIGK